MAREKITLSGAMETTMATVYGKALDSTTPNSILHDHVAAQAIQHIDYDFRRTGMNPTTAAGVALRAKVLDDWVREFLAEHDEATVLNLACGLDTRVHRIDPPQRVRWFDVDYPEVLDLRTRLLPELSGDYRTIASSVTEAGWLEQVPADRPTVVVFEGLTMYLHESDGRAMLQRLTGRFPSGQLLFDCYGKLAIKLQKLVPAVRRAGAALHWGIDDPHEIETLHPGLRLRTGWRSVELPGIEKLPTSGRISMKVMSYLPGLKDVGHILRYEF